MDNTWGTLYNNFKYRAVGPTNSAVELTWNIDKY